MEVTLFGRELEIVRRMAVSGPPAPELRIPLTLRSRGRVWGVDVAYDVYRYEGLGIYRWSHRTERKSLLR